MLKTKNDKPRKHNLKKIAALGIMFGVGISAFATGQSGKLFDVNPENYSFNAVNDIVKVVESIKEASIDFVIDKKEISNIFDLMAEYDKNYGEGSCRFVVSKMTEFSKTPGGISLVTQTGDDSIIHIANQAVRKAALQQEAMRSMGYTLKDYNYGR